MTHGSHDVRMASWVVRGTMYGLVLDALMGPCAVASYSHTYYEHTGCGIPANVLWYYTTKV